MQEGFKSMKHVKNFLKAIKNGLLMIVGLKADKSAVTAGLVDYSGQGRDVFGK